LSECGNDDQDQLDSIHLLSSENISQRSESELSKNGSCRCGDFDGGILGNMKLSVVAVFVDNTQHDGQERGSEDIILICEETNTGYNNSTDMVPAKGSLIDLRKGKSSAFVGILDMSEVVVEVVEGSVATCCGSVCSDFSHCIGVIEGFFLGSSLQNHDAGGNASNICTYPTRAVASTPSRQARAERA